MDNKEKISVELELVTEKFTNKIKNITNKVTKFGDYLKERLTPEPRFDIDNAYEDLRNIKEKIDSTIDPKLKSEYRKTFVAITEDIANYKRNVDEADKETKKFNLNVGKNFKKGINSIKRFSLALFSIRSIWSLVSRASSSYISHDTALANKLQAVWVGLGSMLEPLVSRIADIMIKLVSYINILVRSMTGVDLLAKGINKSLAGTAKNTSKMVAGFDEINNLNESSGGVDTSWASAFENVELNEKWVNYFTKLGESLSKCSKWLPIIIGSAVALTGLAGINHLLGLIAAVGVITLIITLKTNIDKVNEEYEKMKENNNKIAISVDNLMAKYDERIAKLKGTENQTDEYIDTLLDEVDSNNNIINSMLDLEDTDDILLNARRKMIEKNKENIAELKRLKEQYGLNETQEKAYTDAMKKQIDMLTQQNKTIYKNSDEYKQNQKQIEDLQSTLEELTGEKYVINTELKAPATQNYENGLTRFFTSINERINKWSSNLSNWLSGGSKSKLPSYDVGTPYVPNDQIAMIHKGEAIIPAKYNNPTTFNNSSEIVNRLDTLISTLEEKDMSVNLDSKTIGKTAQNYINSQSRIMGRSVI